MPTFRIRAKINGVVRRSWGESANEDEARRQASEQLSKITNDFEILTVEEVDRTQADAELLVGSAIDPTAINIP